MKNEVVMIVWRGYGFLVVLLAVAGMVLGQLGVEALPEGYRPGGAFVGLVLAAALVYGLHRLIEAKQPARVLIDKNTGQEVVFKPKHDLFFIPLKYWSLVLVVLAVVQFFQK
jgi:NADH:ubiquinone oxidoreductase subunit 6 (subunit J)